VKIYKLGNLATTLYKKLSPSKNLLAVFYTSTRTVETAIPYRDFFSFWIPSWLVLCYTLDYVQLFLLETVSSVILELTHSFSAIQSPTAEPGPGAS
jgi:hypothetical protein